MSVENYEVRVIFKTHAIFHRELKSSLITEDIKYIFVILTICDLVFDTNL